MSVMPAAAMAALGHQESWSQLAAIVHALRTPAQTALTDAELREIAARYREEAKRAFEHIEACSLVVAEARKTCADLKDKIPLSAAADRVKTRKK